MTKKTNHRRPHTQSGAQPYAHGLHVVALFEGAKGLLVLLAGFELLSFLHKDIHEVALRLVEHMHLNPASHYPRIFLDAMESVNDTKLWSMALAAALYAVVRMIEAAGLWFEQKWAEWFAILTGGMYIPVEVYEVIKQRTWPGITVLTVNVGVVAYLLSVLLKNGDRSATGR
ncbi:MAG: DUF2127 domain-containing protein [Desulfuromonadaceae bacterium]|nr:DUF2127 domain-containing protein [Desulfuromonadaceae bacterium]